MAAELNLEIEQGATFQFMLGLTTPAGAAIDLTGFTARMQARRNASDAAAFINLTDGNGTTCGGATGLISIEMSSTETAGLEFKTGVYDLEITDGAQVVRVVEGAVTVLSEVTR